MFADLVTLPLNRVTTGMHTGAPGATGNHVTDGDYEQARGMSSMPAKKRLVVEYRETTPVVNDFKPSHVPTGRQLEEDSPTTGHRFTDNGHQLGDRSFHDNPTGGLEGRIGTADGPSFSDQQMYDLNQRACDLQANKRQVLALIADILASGQSNEDKERKLGDIIADLETVRARLAEQKAAQIKVSPVSLSRFLLITVTFIDFARVSPAWRVLPAPFYLSDLVCPLFFVNLPTNVFSFGCHPWRVSPGAVRPSRPSA